jgi:hypothetical protein
MVPLALLIHLVGITKAPLQPTCMAMIFAPVTVPFGLVFLVQLYFKLELTAPPFLFFLASYFIPFTLCYLFFNRRVGRQGTGFSIETHEHRPIYGTRNHAEKGDSKQSETS